MLLEILINSLVMKTLPIFIMMMEMDIWEDLQIQQIQEQSQLMEIMLDKISPVELVLMSLHLRENTMVLDRHNFIEKNIKSMNLKQHILITMESHLVSISSLISQNQLLKTFYLLSEIIFCSSLMVSLFLTQLQLNLGTSLGLK